MTGIMKSFTRLLTLKNLLIVVFAVVVAAAIYMALYGGSFEGFQEGENQEDDVVAPEKPDCGAGQFVKENKCEDCGENQVPNADGNGCDDCPEGEVAENGVCVKKDGFMNAEVGAEVAAAAKNNEHVAGVVGVEADAGYADINADNASPEMPKAKNPASCFPRDSLNPGELLPKEKGDFAAFAPMGEGNLAGRNFLEAGKQIGVDTVGQSLRNANYQLRSEPANPRMNVSVFNNSTIAADSTRRQLEIGSA